MAASTDRAVSEQEAVHHFGELADAARAGRETTITRNGKAYVALVDARKLEHYHHLEREHAHLTLLQEAARGLDDVDQGRHQGVAEFRAKYGR
jgi:antitoxin (DNA-binding transcriptional repressor) of toxin-antitoxin stability system